MDGIYSAVKDLPGLRWTLISQAPTGQPHPLLLIESDDREGGLRVRDLILKLRSLPKKIILGEDEVDPDRAFLAAHCLQPGDAEYIVQSIRTLLNERQ